MSRDATDLPFTGQWNRLHCIAASPDGSLLATGDDVGDVHIWDATSGRRLRRIGGHRGRVNFVVFPAKDASEWDDPDGLRPATPTDFLDKIFQIPYALTRPDSESMRRYLHSLLPAAPDGTKETALVDRSSAGLPVTGPGPIVPPPRTTLSRRESTRPARTSSSSRSYGSVSANKSSSLI